MTRIMDFMTLITYILAIVETAALLACLVFVTKGMKEKKDTAARKGYYRKAAIFVAVYLALNVLRNYGWNT